MLNILKQIKNKNEKLKTVKQSGLFIKAQVFFPIILCGCTDDSKFECWIVI
jgi:hypothetical protein